jgi:hypothetical protein
MGYISYMGCGSAERTLGVSLECARSRYHLQASGKQRVSVSPSPPLEERVGERRHVTILAVAARGSSPAGRRPNLSCVLAENDGLLSLTLSSKGGEGNRTAA